jgi:histone-lysine N-methyltransferase SETMAR
MSTFVPEKRHLREALLFMFNLKKSATEAYQLLENAYGNYALCKSTCQVWFQRFKDGDFDLNDKEHGRPSKKFEDIELQALLDEDDTQTQQQLADTLNVAQKSISNRLHEMGKIQKVGKWVPYELTERQKEKRKTTCEILFESHQRKSFLHRIITGDEKWIYLDNQKRKKSWVDPGKPSTSTAKPNIHGQKYLLCICWDQQGILFYQLLQPDETVTGDRYRQQIIDLSHELKAKRPEWATRHEKVKFLHDNARPHVAKLVKDTLKELNWDQIPHPPYSPDIAPSDYHLFRSMAHGLSEQRFTNYSEVKNWLEEWIASKPTKFFYDGIHNLPIIWENVIINDGNYLE